MADMNRRADALNKENAKRLAMMRESLEEAIAGAQEDSGRTEDLGKLQELQAKLNCTDDVADCLAIVFDCCTLTLPRSVDADDAPFLVPVYTDPYFLRCCVTPVEMPAYTPCGLVDGCMVNEVRATGPLPYYLSINLDTYFNGGQGNCTNKTMRTFSCSKTVCVDEVLCYAPLDDEEPCPDFCNNNIFSIALRRFIDFCGDEVKITYWVFHFLPDCDGEAPAPR